MGTTDASARKMLAVADYGDGPDPDMGPAGEMVKRLAKVYEELAYGHADIAGPPSVYGFDAEGGPIPLEVTVDAPEFDRDSWSYRTVTVRWPDGATVQGFYRVDGRA